MEEYGSARWSKEISIKLEELSELVEKIQQNTNGGGGEIPSSIQTQVNNLIDSVSSLQTALSSLQTDFNNETGLLNTIISNYNTLQTTVSNLSDEVGALSGLPNAVSSVSADLSALSSTVSQMGTNILSLQSSLSQNSADILELQTNDAVQDSLIETLKQNDIVNREIQNADEVFDVSTICEIEARLTADTVYPIDAFKAKQGQLTKLHVMFCARAYASGEYGSARMDFYIDDVLINSTTVTCEDDNEHLYEFEYNFLPSGLRQEIKMEMIHLSLTESNKNVRICVQYIKMRLQGYNCFFYEQINSPVSVDCDNTTDYFTGSNPCLTFGNISRYVKLWEKDCVTKVERNWNTGVSDSLRNVTVPQSSLFRAKKLSVTNIYNSYTLKRQQFPVFFFLTASNAMMYFSVNYNISGAVNTTLLYQSNVYGTIGCILQVNNQLPYYDVNNSLYDTYHNTDMTIYDAVILYKEAGTGDWKACLTYNKNTFQLSKTAGVTMPSTIGTIVDIFSCFQMYDVNNPYFCLFLITNSDDEIYLYDFEPDTTKMGNPFLDNFLVGHSNGYFPLYIDKGINPFAYSENGKLHIFFSFQNRIYKRVYDFQLNTLSKRQYVCDGQYYFEGPGGYHIRNQGVMSHVFKSDLQQ